MTSVMALWYINWNLPCDTTRLVDPTGTARDGYSVKRMGKAV